MVVKRATEGGRGECLTRLCLPSLLGMGLDRVSYSAGAETLALDLFLWTAQQVCSIGIPAGVEDR